MVAVDTDHMEHHGDPGAIRTRRHLEYPVDRLLAAKGETTVSVCLPARNESETVGPIVDTLVQELLAPGVIDDVLVIDDHSTDDTADVAAAAGARVRHSEHILPAYGEGHGKGEVLWKSLLETTGDIVLWCDSDLTSFHHRFVSGLLGPMLCEADVDFVKGFYRRPESEGEGGGRVTELVARPLIALLFPELNGIHQPLSGEYGGRRQLLEQLPFVEGYGVEIGLLIDIARRFGTNGIVQVDLDVRHHRNRPLHELGPQAASIMQTALRRADRDLVGVTAELLGDQGSVTVEAAERPPMIEVGEYLARIPAAVGA
ncbi:MAG: glucosyl-3-phosphoglycerate synthase [Microthrixaceae bacterium]